MIIDDLNVKCVALPPPERDPPLVVDPDAEAAGAVAFQLLQPVTGWHEQILETPRGIQEEQLPPRRPLHGLKTGDGFIVEQPFGVATPEGLDHETSLLLHGYYVKRKAVRAVTPHSREAMGGISFSLSRAVFGNRLDKLKHVPLRD